jgi:hypothetical protein
VVPEDPKHYREVIVDRYRIMYSIEDETEVWITNVFGPGVDVSANLRPMTDE